MPGSRITVAPAYLQGMHRDGKMYSVTFQKELLVGLFEANALSNITLTSFFLQTTERTLNLLFTDFRGKVLTRGVGNKIRASQAEGSGVRILHWDKRKGFHVLKSKPDQKVHFALANLKDFGLFEL